MAGSGTAAGGSVLSLNLSRDRRGDSRSGAGPTLQHKLDVAREGVRAMAKLGFERGAREI